jgi:archaemetzincin
LIDGVVAVLGREYALPILRLRYVERPVQTYDATRRQHSSRVMLAWLAAQLATEVEPPGSRACVLPVRLLGVTDVDLFIPVLTFVFGEAQLGGRAAVMSIARLAEAANSARLASRVVKEAVHELGHTFGLVHCPSAACVMSRSAGLTAVDLKGDRLCADCRVRYRELTEQSHVTTESPHSDR